MSVAFFWWSVRIFPKKINWGTVESHPECGGHHPRRQGSEGIRKEKEKASQVLAFPDLLLGEQLFFAQLLMPLCCAQEHGAK